MTTFVLNPFPTQGQFEPKGGQAFVDKADCVKGYLMIVKPTRQQCNLPIEGDYGAYAGRSCWQGLTPTLGR